MSGLPCPNCGSELAFLSQYQRHYCYACGKYAPEGFGDRGAKRCPTCTGILSFVTQYDRYYCYRCSAYPPVGVFMEPRAEAGSDAGESATGTSPALIVIKPETEQQTVTYPDAASASPVERLAEEEIRPEGAEPEKQRRPLDREEITTAKKPLLMQLCKDYDLDSSGTREELRQRLLSYLDQLDEGSASEPRAEPTEGIAAEEDGPADGAAVESAAAAEQEAPEATSEQTEPTIVAGPEPEPSTPTVNASIAVVETTPERETREATIEPAAVVTPWREPTAVAAPSQAAARVEHPCPTCGRALTYISQYGRWYCYSCRAYAPRGKAKFACPTCGGSLRWIRQYSRWWCDACRRYAPADLPRPEGSIEPAASAQAVAARPAVAAATAFVHRHQNPGGGIGLVTFGLLLFVVYEVLVDLPFVLSVNTGLAVAPDVAFGLRFFGILFVAVGTILGLSAIRDRR